MMNTNIWNADYVKDAILDGNVNLEIVFSNYLKSFVVRLADYIINLQEIGSVELLYNRVLEGIEKLEEMRKEFIEVIDFFTASNHFLLKRYLPDFFEKLLNFYEEHGITLYTGESADVLKNDHYRYFNQSLFIELTALLLENRCFETLAAILLARYKVFYSSFGMTREVNFLLFQKYNYTLNDYLNTSSPKRLSVTADYIRKYSKQTSFEKLIRADILLYYISLWNKTDDLLTPYWYPELSVYNREAEILPHMVSKLYFEKAKVLFGVKDITEYKSLLDNTEDLLQRGGVYRVPSLKVGLLYDKVGSME